MLSLLTISLLGFAILGAFIYYNGDIDDNSDISFRDISEDYYPGDLKMVFIAMAWVIPVAITIRLLSNLIIIASIAKILTMGAIFCKGASMRWILSYLIYTLLNLFSMKLY